MISAMAARLLVNAFSLGDFTGWNDPEDIGGLVTYMMPLSADDGIHRWSIIAEAVDASSYRYTLVVEYRSDRSAGQHFKFPVREAVLNESDPEHPRLVVSLYYGENLVLDCVKRPVYRPTQVPTEPVAEDGEGQDDDVEEDTGRGDGRPGRGLGGLGFGARRTREDGARYNRPPRPRMTFRRGGNGGSV